MRTTIHIDPDLLTEAKQLAVRTGKTLTALIEEALREALLRRRKPIPRNPTPLTIVGGRGLRPGIDLDDSAQLLDLLDRGDEAL